MEKPAADMLMRAVEQVCAAGILSPDLGGKATTKEVTAAVVEAVGAGTGSEFSVLPAQNATGNWVKVTQRVPVRIAIDSSSGDRPLIAGLSANVTVHVGDK